MSDTTDVTHLARMLLMAFTDLDDESIDTELEVTMPVQRMAKSVIVIYDEGWEQNLGYLQRDILEASRTADHTSCADQKDKLISRMADVLDRYQLVLRNAYAMMDTTE